MIYGYDIVADFENKRQLENLKEQLEKLKEENKEIKNFHINLVGVKECEIRELLKLKQTLTEIKEIAEAYGHWNVNASVSGYKQILQIISDEVVND